jgi:YbgC/YbaW family acyl-CoA thioester hydrolase
MPSKFETLIEVRPSDIDGNRHVHNTVYFDYVLAARYDQMARCYKVPMSTFDEHGWSWMIRAAEIEHKRPLLIGDTARVRTWVEGIGDAGRGKRARSLCTIRFEIESVKSGKVAARGRINYVMVDAKTGSPVEIPDFIIEKYSI